MAAALSLAAVIPAASASADTTPNILPPTPRAHRRAASASADTTLNIVPHGNEATGVPWASAPGILPADTQAKMYDRITPLFRNITEQQLVPSTDGSGYYKSAALLAEDDPSFVSSETVS